MSGPAFSTATFQAFTDLKTVGIPLFVFSFAPASLSP
jgi:hypothetical protein